MPKVIVQGYSGTSEKVETGSGLTWSRVEFDLSTFLETKAPAWNQRICTRKTFEFLNQNCHDKQDTKIVVVELYRYSWNSTVRLTCDHTDFVSYSRPLENARLSLPPGDPDWQKLSSELQIFQIFRFGTFYESSNTESKLIGVIRQNSTSQTQISLEVGRKLPA